jgi:hypothetical protein
MAYGAKPFGRARLRPMPGTGRGLSSRVAPRQIVHPLSASAGRVRGKVDLWGSGDRFSLILSIPEKITSLCLSCLSLFRAKRVYWVTQG